MYMKDYVSIGCNHRLTKEDSRVANFTGESYYYRLYEKSIDEFGNEFWTQIWAGSRSSNSTDKYAAILAESLYFNKVTK